MTLTRRRKKLDEMTKGDGLGNAYAATLSRIKSLQRGRSKLGMEVLMWVSHAERPLHVDELRHALGVEGSIDLDIGNIPAIETLLACSLRLVTVEKSSSTVRLVHYSLQEYLSHNRNLFLKPHSLIAEVCLTYLDFWHVRGFSPALRSAPSSAPLVEYASDHWGTHARRGNTKSVRVLALKLIDRYDKHISWKILLLHGLAPRNYPFGSGDIPRGFTGLHGAAYLGYVELIVDLLETNKWDAQAVDFDGNTAIAWAARREHVGVVKVLLERNDVNPDKADRRGQTPLWWAATNGYEEVVRILLERNDINPDKADEYNQTPLMQAAANGCEGDVRMLLELNDVNPNKMNMSSRTPLMQAAGNGCEGLVRVLLVQNGVYPDKADMYNETPLIGAATNGHEGVVRVPLERSDVDPNEADKDNQTPLFRAAANEHDEVVKILLGRNDINPDKADKYNQTPLLQAPGNGYEGIVRMLLERNDVDPNRENRWGQTPLSVATLEGKAGVVKILLEWKTASPNPPNTEYCQTQLQSNSVLLHEQARVARKHAPSLQSTEPRVPEPSEPSEPPSKKARKSRYPRRKLGSSLHQPDLPSPQVNLSKQNPTPRTGSLLHVDQPVTADTKP